MPKKKAKILIRKGKKQYFEDLDREVTVVNEKHFYVDDLSKDFSTQYGSIKKADLKKKGTIKSSQGKDFCIFDAGFIDNYKRMRRLPQIIPLKDIGFIIAKTGVGPDSIIIEGGTGSGARTGSVPFVFGGAPGGTEGSRGCWGARARTRVSGV